jgi:peptidoglycan/LPS O-acetylase OafA/YrhL
MTSAQTAAPARSWARIDGVDLLRGLAIFFVLMNHVNMRLLFAHVPYTKALPRQLVSSLVWNGQFGVQIFFAVSGFLITSTALRRWGSPARVSIRDFYLLRFARIAPLLLSLLAVLSILHAAQVGNFIVSSKTGGLGRALLAALTFHVNVLEASRGYLPASWDILWSLSVEEMFYLFFPLACRLLGKGKLLTLFLFAFVALGPFARTMFAQGNPVWREYSYLGGMDAIALGCLTALFAARHTLTKLALRTIGSVGGSLLAFILCFTTLTGKLGLERSGMDMTLVGLATCMVIAAASQTHWRSPRVLMPLCILGQRSYEIYLTHMFVVFGLFGLFVSAGKPVWLVPALFAAIILVSLLLGAVVARVYSEPLNRRIRARFGDAPSQLGSVVADSPALSGRE